MDCKHEIGYLMGTADGIVCRRCGRLFKSMDEINAEAEKPAEAPTEAQAKPKRSRKKKEDA